MLAQASTTTNNIIIPHSPSRPKKGEATLTLNSD